MAMAPAKTGWAKSAPTQPAPNEKPQVETSALILIPYAIKDIRQSVASTAQSGT